MRIKPLDQRAELPMHSHGKRNKLQIPFSSLSVEFVVTQSRDVLLPSHPTSSAGVWRTLCQKRGTLEHILSCCLKALAEGCYCWHHEQMLKVIVNAICTDHLQQTRQTPCYGTGLATKGQPREIAQIHRHHHSDKRSTKREGLHMRAWWVSARAKDGVLDVSPSKLSAEAILCTGPSSSLASRCRTLGELSKTPERLQKRHRNGCGLCKVIGGIHKMPSQKPC